MVRLRIQKPKLKTVIRWLLGCLILAPLLWLFYILAGRALCYIAIAQIGELTNTKIRTESVRFHTDGSVFIRNLVISPDENQNGDDAILKAEAVSTRFSIGSLLLLRPRLKAIDVNGFIFNAQYDLDTGRSNLSALKIKFPKGGSGKMPRIGLEAGTLQYSKISSGQVNIALAIPLNATFEFDEETQEGYGFDITTATMAHGSGTSHLTGYWKPGSVTITGGISSTDVSELEMAWIIDVLAAELKYDQDGTFSLKLRTKDLYSKRSPALDRLALVGPAFLGKSGPFAALQRFFVGYQPWGRVDIDLDVSGNFNELSESKLAGKVYCRDVAFCYYKCQYVVEHLVGQIDFTKNSVALNNLCGKHGDVKLFFDGWSRDFGPDCRYKIQIASDNMALDDDLYDVLTAEQQESWSAFSPSGFAAIDYQFSRQSQTDKTRKLAVELRGAEAVYKHVPYPLKNLTGKLSFDRDNVIFSDVVSQVNESKITLNGEIATRSENGPTYDISIKVNDVPLDATLEAALPDKQRNLYKQFHPAGLADGWIKVSTQDSKPASFTADLSFKEASLKSDQVPFPISDISAKAVFTPDSIIVKHFAGRYAHGLVSLTGQIWPDQEQRQSRYRLSLNLEQAQLNNDLFDLLPESLKEVICEFTPEGKVNLRADLNKESLIKPPVYKITVDCLADSITFPQFPYSIDDITGTLTVDADTIELKDITGTLGDSVPAAEKPATIRLNGELTLADSALASALLQLSANDISFDERLALALPQRIQLLYAKLSPAGRFDLDFDSIRIRRADNGQKSIDFAGAVTFKSCNFEISGVRAELDAVLKEIKGLYTGDGLSSCEGTLNGGTLKIHGKSFTNLNADVHYDPNARSWFTENLFADCYGGKLKGKLEIRQPTEQASRYVLQTGFDNIDLRRFLSDAELEDTPDSSYTSGKMNGSLNISSLIGESSSRIGTCRLTINDMQVGRLSPLAKLLQISTLTEPRDFAFDRMFVDSYIKRNGLFVKKLDLSGQSNAFYGSGWMDLQSHNIDLTLTARGRRPATDDPSVLQSLTEGLGRGVVRMEITGNLYDPAVTTKTLPVIESTLQILGTKPATPD